MAASGNREAQGSRRPRQQARRCHRVEFTLIGQEMAALAEAAGRARLARGAYAAQVVLTHVNGGGTGPEAVDREALLELITASGLVRKIGVLLNQAVTKLIATGQRSGDLLACAIECMRHVERLDVAAEEVRGTLR